MVKTSSSNNNVNDNTINGEGRKRKYKGVRMRSWGSWVSEIRAPNQKTRIWLGSYSTAEAAARAYDAALFILKGSNGTFNFPISTNPLNHNLHHNNNDNKNIIMSPKSIQRIAAAAAAADSAITSDTSFCHPSPPSSSSSSSSSIVSEENVSTTVVLDDWAELGAFQSPKYAGEMLNAWAICGYSQVEDCEEDAADIRLWSF